MKMNVFVPLLAFIKGTTGFDTAAHSPLEKSQQDIEVKEPVPLKESPANQPIKGPSSEPLSADSVSETPVFSGESAIPAGVKQFLEEVNNNIETQLLALAESGDLEKVSANELSKVLLQKIEARISEDKDNANHHEKAGSNSEQANNIHPALGIAGVGIAFLTYLYALKNMPEDANIVELAAAFALKHGTTIVANPITGAYAGYQIAGSAGAVAGSLAGGLAVNPGAVGELQELVTLLKNHATDGIVHGSQQARQTINRGVTSARDGTVDRYQRVKQTINHRSQQARQTVNRGVRNEHEIISRSYDEWLFVIKA